MKKDEIIQWLNNQMMFADSISPFEIALQLIFTDWNSSDNNYVGKNEDEILILNKCNSLRDINKNYFKYLGNFNFEKTKRWQLLVNRQYERVI
jgi:hypothetical protein